VRVLSRSILQLAFAGAFGLLAVNTVAQSSAPPTPTPTAEADPHVDLFARKCGSCHTVGKGVRVGPDLKDVLQRRNRAWVERFVKTPSSMLDSDADARQLLAQFNGVRMPDLGLNEAEARGLADLLERCSQAPCDLAGKFVAVTNATPADFARGRELFVGHTALSAGAAPCLSCHTVRGAAGRVPGGTLAKDLTNVYARLGDQGLDAALKAPAFPVMNKIFGQRALTADEAFALRAYLWDANRQHPAPEDHLSLPVLGALGTLGVLGILNAAWARRLKGVRQPLVRQNGRRP
jgi:mono/diheme cytochrome c family protein